MAYRVFNFHCNPNQILVVAIPASPVVLLCPSNFVRDRPYCFTWSPNHEEHHQSLMLRAWFLHHDYAICPDRDLNPEPSYWRTCVLTMRPPRLSCIQTVMILVISMPKNNVDNNYGKKCAFSKYRIKYVLISSS